MAELCRTWANTCVAMVTKSRVGDVVARIIIKQDAWKMFSTIMNMLSLMLTHEQALIDVRMFGLTSGPAAGARPQSAAGAAGWTQ